MGFGEVADFAVYHGTVRRRGLKCGPAIARRFVSVHAAAHDTSNAQHYPNSRRTPRACRAEAVAQWRAAAAAAA